MSPRSTPRAVAVAAAVTGAALGIVACGGSSSKATADAATTSAAATTAAATTAPTTVAASTTPATTTTTSSHKPAAARKAKAKHAAHKVTHHRAAAASGGGSAPATGTTAASTAPQTTQLNGTFRLAAGRFKAGKASGSYFRMIFPGRTRYFNNPDSAARNRTFTLVSPGTAGGLVTGRFQPHPSKVFDRIGNARASSIIRPQRFAGVKFSLATLAKDPQSHRGASPPSFTATGGKITGRLPSLTAEWNNQYFNQGAPKPGGSVPLVTGTYRASTGAFVLVWKSKIKGGPFGGFTGSWHLAGTFVAG